VQQPVPLQVARQVLSLEARLELLWVLAWVARRVMPRLGQTRRT
jgi:flagellar biogenesis protein FliO